MFLDDDNNNNNDDDDDDDDDNDNNNTCKMYIHIYTHKYSMYLRIYGVWNH